jgi:hypothetical protein
MFPVHKARFSITPSSGDGSANTLKFSGAELIQIYTKALTPTTIYDVLIVDEDSDVVLEFNAIEGEYEEHAIYMPLRGVYTVQISDSTVDEPIVVKLMINE